MSAFLQRWRAAPLLLLMLLAVNSAILLGGRTLLPITTSLGLVLPPYGYIGPGADGLTTLDPWGALNAGYAYDLYLTRAVKSGSLPLWNPYQGLGQPFLANDLSAILYPVNWLHLLLPHDWWDLVWVLNWWLAALFLCAYLELIGVPREAAFVGAAAVFASGFFQGYLPLRELPAVAAWWPLLLYGVERAIQDPAWRLRHLVLALAVYCTITGGQPEVTFLSLVTALVYGLLRLPREWRRASNVLGAVIPGPLAGLLLAAPAWVNFAQYAFTAFSIHPAGSVIGREHLHPTTLAAYVFRFLYGRIHTRPFGPVAGWEWNWNPGWLPATVVFLALLALSATGQRRSFGLRFLWGVAAITGAKIWGVPGVDLLGRLPLFERVGFPRFAAFLLALACAGLAAHGVHALATFDNRRWRRWVSLWCVLIGIVFTVGVLPLWPVISKGELSSQTMLSFLTFGGLGLLWALLGPLGLWWLAARRPHEHRPLYFLAALGILLHGVATACNGYVLATYALLSVGGLGVYAVSALVLGLRPKTAVNSAVIVAGLVLVALPPVAAALSTSPGLALRYDPLKRPPYLDVLTAGRDVNLHRSYSLDTAFQANFALPFAITSLNVLEAILPTESAEFLHGYLDRGANPLWFLGNLSPNRKANIRALDEFWHNKRYFDLVGVRYLLTHGASPRRVLYQTGTAGSKRELAPLSQPLEVSLLCPTDSLSTVAVFLSNLGRRNPGTVSLEIFGDDGVLLRRQDLDGAAVKNDSFQEFSFPPLQGKKGRELRVRIEFVPAHPGAMIATLVYPYEPAEGFALRVVEPHPDLALVYDDPHTQVQVWENPSAVPRVFLAPTARTAAPSWHAALGQLPHTENLTRAVWPEFGPDLFSSWPETQMPGELLGFELMPNTVQIRYQAKTAGILTLTDSYAQGWRATVNGREAPVLRVDGVFRGVRIEEPGTYEVVFWYRPPYWALSLGMAMVGALWLIGAQWGALRNEPVFLSLSPPLD